MRLGTPAAAVALGRGYRQPLRSLCGCHPAYGCGQRAVAPLHGPRVVGGEDAVPHSWPWQVRGDAGMGMGTGTGTFPH